MCSENVCVCCMHATKQKSIKANIFLQLKVKVQCSIKFLTLNKVKN